MKDGIHPNYREVVFLDTSCDFGFVTRSTVATNETIKWKDGKEYPVYKIEISSESHPFYTGKQKIMDTAGRVDKFKKRYARKGAAKPPGLLEHSHFQVLAQHFGLSQFHRTFIANPLDDAAEQSQRDFV